MASRVLNFERTVEGTALVESDGSNLSETHITTEAENRPFLRIVGTEDHEPGPRAGISTERLYPVREALTVELASALRLLSEGLKHTEEAMEAREDEDIVSADDALNRLDLIMPEMFSCRAVGEGYAAATNSIMNALRNRSEGPLNMIQIRTIWLTLKELRSRPFLSFASALDLIEDLEKVGLNLDPPAFQSLVDWIDE